MALSLAAGAAFAKTPYHDGTAEVITPTDKNHPLGEVVSGYDFRKAMIRDVQDDDFENPAMLVVDHGEELWETVDGSSGKSLSQVFEGCAEVPLGVVGSVYPRFNFT
jgi:sulfur-oxidizing protein SoxA